MELSPVGIGVISGLVTFIIIAGGKKIWDAVIVSWYEDKVYGDVRLDGSWGTVFHRDDEKVHETATVHQKANKVTGVIQFEEETTIRQYEFRGQIANLLLTAEYWLKGPSSRDRGTFCVVVKEDGKRLEGYLSWYSDRYDEIKFSTYVWNKR